MARLVLLVTTIGLLVPHSTARAQSVQSAHEDDHGSQGPGPDSGLAQVVRDNTQQFLDVKAAEKAQYFPFLGCVSGTQEGAMGIHYVNMGLVGDGEVHPEAPEVLLYEKRNGKLYLTGAEFVVFAEQWDAANPQPPELLGQVFAYNESPNRFGLPNHYALHVWAWKDNPHGTFVDWNPQVSCDGFVSRD